MVTVKQIGVRVPPRYVVQACDKVHKSACTFYIAQDWDMDNDLDDQDFMGRKLTVSGARSEGPKESKEGEKAPKSDSTEKPAEETQSEEPATAEETTEAPAEESAPVAEETSEKQPAEAQEEEEPKQDAAEATA